MAHEVHLKKRVAKSLPKLPEAVQTKFWLLVADLEARGPVAGSWPNYSRLTGNNHHCHLTRDYVACWSHEPDTIIVEVYYVGSRQGAPY